jgi:hypothetical protein
MSEVKVYSYNKSVKKAIKRSAPKTLKSAGAYVRAIARNSIKKRRNPNISSAPGLPPHQHTTFKNTIRYAVNNAENAVYIGPEIVKGGKENAGRLHEFGGIRRIKPQSKQYHVGSSGPIAGTDRFNAVYTRLRTNLQVARAEKLAAKFYPWIKGGIRRYPARPYMRPALMAGLPKLSKFWNNAIKP